MNKVWTLIFASLVLLSGCNKKFTDIFYRGGSNLAVNDFEFQHLSAKTKVDFESEEHSISGVANLRIEKDSIIWISFSPGLGIEAVRVLITRDTIAILDKINKTYTEMNFRDLSEKFDFDLSFDLVQSVILGNLLYPYDREKVLKTNNYFTYNRHHGIFYFENFIGTRTMKLEKVQVQDTVSGNSISVNYGEFQLVEGQVFPFEIFARLRYSDDNKESTNIEIEFKQAEIEKKPLKFPFHVSQKYERK